MIGWANYYAEGSLSPEQITSEIESVLREIERMEPRVVLEIGTGRGGTFFLLARAASPHATMISVDLPGGDFGGGYGVWRTLVYRQLVRSKQRGKFLRLDSHDPDTLAAVQDALEGRQVDVLFLDGDHTYEGIKQDYEMYSGLVRRGGLILFHDIVPASTAHGCDVARFWQEIKQGQSCEEFVENWKQNWGGIGVIRYPGSTSSPQEARPGTSSEARSGGTV